MCSPLRRAAATFRCRARASGRADGARAALSPKRSDRCGAHGQRVEDVVENIYEALLAESERPDVEFADDGEDFRVIDVLSHRRRC